MGVAVFRSLPILLGVPEPATAQPTSEKDVLALVGQPQTVGRSIDGLGWQVSKERAEPTYRRAVIVALHKLRGKPAEAARAFEVEVDRLQGEELSSETQIAPLVRDGMRPAAKVAMATLVSPSEKQDVVTTVVADVLLRMSKAGDGQTA